MDPVIQHHKTYKVHTIKITKVPTVFVGIGEREPFKHNPKLTVFALLNCLPLRYRSPPSKQRLIVKQVICYSEANEFTVD